MVYKDKEGIEHAIYIPLGQFKQACQHLVDEDWEALAQFPSWSTYRSRTVWRH